MSDRDRLDEARSRATLGRLGAAGWLAFVAVGLPGLFLYFLSTYPYGWLQAAGLTVFAGTAIACALVLIYLLFASAVEAFNCIRRGRT